MSRVHIHNDRSINIQQQNQEYYEYHKNNKDVHHVYPLINKYHLHMNRQNSHQ